MSDDMRKLLKMLDKGDAKDEALARLFSDDLISHASNMKYLTYTIKDMDTRNGYFIRGDYKITAAGHEALHDAKFEIAKHRKPLIVSYIALGISLTAIILTIYQLFWRPQSVQSSQRKEQSTQSNLQ